MSKVIRFFNTYEPVNSFYRDLLPALVNVGAEVQVYISQAEYRAERGKLQDVFNQQNLNLISNPSFRIKPENRWNKAILMFLYGLSATVKSIFSSRADLNVFLTQPPLFGLLGVLLKKLKGQPYACIIMDLYPDVAVEGGYLNEKSAFTKLLQHLSKFIMRHSKLIVVIGRCQLQRLVSKGISRDKIKYIPNWVNEHLIRPVSHEHNTLRNDLGYTNEDFIVLYSGNMGVSHEFETLLGAAQKLSYENQIKFLFIGGGARRAELEQRKLALQLANVNFLPFQSAVRLSESLSMGDVHIVTLKKGFEGLVVPSKAYGALAVGRPLVYVGDAEGEIATMIGETNIGTHIKIGDSDSLVKTIITYFNNRSLLNAHGTNGMSLFKEKYTHVNGISAYKNLFLQNYL